MKILKLTQRQIGLLQIPIIGIEIDDMYINEDKYGGDLQVILKISNLGTVPALEIKVDSEIKLKYSKYGDEKIPSTDGLSFHPFLRAGEVLSQNSDFISVTQFYDSLFAKNLMLNFKKNNELNEERLKNAQEVKHDSATLSIYIYYKNNLNQNFRSYFETNIVTDFGRNKQANPSDESQHLIQIYLQNRKFCSEPISEREFFEEIKKREVKRKKIQEMA
ncbi:MAG TPA: hypothetical protein VMS83_02670 [Methanoregula sp.]|nr:hypothetical protein [Methanoregula sp.]